MRGIEGPEHIPFHAPTVPVEAGGKIYVAGGGVQSVRPHVGETDTRGAWQASGELLWRVLPSARVVLGVDALDVYGAYRREGVRLGVVRTW